MKAHWLNNPLRNVATFMDSVYMQCAGLVCVGSERDEAVCREVADAMLNLGRTPLLTQRSRRRRDGAGIRGSRQLRALRAEDLRRLVEGGRAQGHDAADSSSSSLDLEVGGADALAAKRSRAGEYFQTKFDGGLGDVRVAERLARQKARPRMSLEPKLEAELRRATHRGVPQMRVASSSAPSRKVGGIAKSSKPSGKS